MLAFPVSFPFHKYVEALQRFNHVSKTFLKKSEIILFSKLRSEPKYVETPIHSAEEEEAQFRLLVFYKV
jgi:hypothetical protein